MKTGIFIFDGIRQVVLTPETEVDNQVCALIEKGTAGALRGSVYECQGGWIRFHRVRVAGENAYYEPGWTDGSSLIVRISDEKAGGG